MTIGALEGGIIEVLGMLELQSLRTELAQFRALALGEDDVASIAVVSLRLF